MAVAVLRQHSHCARPFFIGFGYFFKASYQRPLQVIMFRLLYGILRRRPAVWAFFVRLARRAREDGRR